MRKNGFIASSILYSFFLVFVTLFIALVLNYLHNRVLLTTIDEASRKMLQQINNTKISDLIVGDKVRFETVPGQQIVNSDAAWTVAYIETTGNTKKYYFLSDLDMHNLDIKYKLNSDAIEKWHATTLDVYQELLGKGVYNKLFQYNRLNVSIPTMSAMKTIRNQSLPSRISNAIYGVGGSYVVLSDIAEDNYKLNKFYEMRMYSFNDVRDQSPALISNYCGGTYQNETSPSGSKTVKLLYNANNKFGYMNIMNETVKNEEYINYCSYANPLSYTHKATDHVVAFDENATNGDEVITTYTSLYTLRLMATTSVDINATNTYIAGGKGTNIDPYLVTNGVKQS